MVAAVVTVLVLDVIVIALRMMLRVLKICSRRTRW